MSYVTLLAAANRPRFAAAGVLTDTHQFHVQERRPRHRLHADGGHISGSRAARDLSPLDVHDCLLIEDGCACIDATAERLGWTAQLRSGTVLARAEAWLAAAGSLRGTETQVLLAAHTANVIGERCGHCRTETLLTWADAVLEQLLHAGADYAQRWQRAERRKLIEQSSRRWALIGTQAAMPSTVGDLIAMCAIDHVCGPRRFVALLDLSNTWMPLTAGPLVQVVPLTGPLDEDLLRATAALWEPRGAVQGASSDSGADPLSELHGALLVARTLHGR